MADSKYGRIFTEDDVRSLMYEASQTGAKTVDILRMIADFKGRFPKDEPVFVLRAKDRRSLSPIRQYYQTCTTAERPAEHLDGIEHAMAAFEDFRTAHPDHLKEPD